MTATLAGTSRLWPWVDVKLGREHDQFRASGSKLTNVILAALPAPPCSPARTGQGCHHSA